MLHQILPKLQRVKEYDKYYSAICVFHQDTKPSMLVFKDGWFRCLACGRSGDLYSLSKKLTGQESPSLKIQREATTWNAPYESIKGGLDFAMSAHDTLVLCSESLAWYLRMRRIDDRIEAQKLGWHNGWYTIPFFAADGSYQGIGMRAGLHIEEANGARYYIPTKTRLYVPDWRLVYSSQYVVVVFGLIDALSLVSLRIPAMSVTHGKSITAEDFDDIRKPIIFIPDHGEEVEAIQVARKLSWRGRVARINWMDDMKDVNDLHIAKKENIIFSAIENAR
ncbi:MAG: DNA primase [Syntrophomonadaceae bacterium]|nr:DNA primase [Bacillota bacterium]